MDFERFSKKIKPDDEKRVVSIDVRLKVINFTGTIYFTDIMLQEEDTLTGYTVETNTIPKMKDEENNAVLPRFFNGIIRGETTTIVYPNSGSETTGLDCYIYPQQSISRGNISISHVNGAQKAVFLESAKAGDELALLATTRRALKNRIRTRKSGGFQYSSAGNNRHIITLGNGKRANILVELQEMQDSEVRL